MACGSASSLQAAVWQTHRQRLASPLRRSTGYKCIAILATDQQYVLQQQIAEDFFVQWPKEQQLQLLVTDGQRFHFQSPAIKHPRNARFVESKSRYSSSTSITAIKFMAGWTNIVE